MAVAVRPGQKLTVDEVCDELQIARSTFYDWRQKGRGPRCIRLPNGSLRIRRRREPVGTAPSAGALMAAAPLP
ncbi:helix-turn-helix transcriptional regulator [Streptomyces sp. NPDC057474]|uniref:helix-turn-helix transcriptional regulator n=1 Tax=Streptomyces sp. NPDC057474 TaxID=3346144 RepID=UPI003676D43C